MRRQKQPNTLTTKTCQISGLFINSISAIREETEEEIQELREKNERILRRFFKAGVTPDFAQNPEDTNALEGS